MDYDQANHRKSAEFVSTRCHTECEPPESGQMCSHALSVIRPSIASDCSRGSAGNLVGSHRRRRKDAEDPDSVTNNITADSRSQTVCDFLKSKLFVVILFVCCAFITLLCVGLVLTYEKESDVTLTVDAWNDKLSAEQLVWFEEGLDDLKQALHRNIYTKRAKNVILFVGDGMGPATVTAARIYKGKEEGHLAWERFPHMGSLKTYCMDKQVPDSMCTATALFGGVKANYETGGVDGAVPLGDCQASLTERNHVESILHWAQNAGMGTGFVTNTRVVHATPAALYAHAADRRWECDGTMPEAARGQCADIGRQLVENAPGNRLNVIMGGGRQCLVANVTGSAADPIDTWSCQRQDGRDLIEEWAVRRRNNGERHAIVRTSGELDAIDASADFVMGIFANGHLKYDSERDTGPNGMPSLAQMTEKAIDILAHHDNGFVLVVEGGLIDQAHHRGWARQALHEVLALDRAINGTVLRMAKDIEETLIIVTSDHAHTLSINGYPERGTSIFGTAQNSKAAGQVPYTTLSYATGGPAGFQVDVNEAGQPVRRDPTKEDTSRFDYVQQVAILTDENTHSGIDVSIHAIGPWAHLFHRVHEQSYVAHVISFAARIGRFRDSHVTASLMNWIGL